MPRIQKTGWTPKYRLHKRSGRAYVHLAGEDHWLGQHGSEESRVAYERAVAEWIVAGKPTAPRASGAGGRITVADLILAFWRHAQAAYPAGTLAVLRSALRVLRRLYGPVPVVSAPRA